MAEQSRQSCIPAKSSENIEISVLKTRMDEFQRQLIKKVGGCVTLAQFNELSTVLESKANVSEVNEALQQKVSKQYMGTALQKKVNKTQLQSQLSKKADTTDLQYIVSSLQSKVSVTTLEKLTQVLDNKVDKSELAMVANQRNLLNRSQLRAQEGELQERLQQLKSHHHLEMKELKAELQLMAKQYQALLQAFKKEIEVDLHKNLALLDTDHNKRISAVKMDIADQVDSMRQPFKALQEQGSARSKQLAVLSGELAQRKRQEESIYHQIDQLRKKFQQFAWKALEKQEFIDFKSEITQLAESKIETEEVQAGFNKFEASINVRLAADRTQNAQLVKELRDQLLAHADAATAETQEVRRLLQKKVDRGDVGNNEQALRKVRKEVDQCRKTVDLIYNQIQTKLSVKEYQTDLLQIRKRFQSVSKEVSLKASIKDVCVLSDSKPNIDDVNNALREINEALADKVTEADLQNILKDQAHINETLCSQNIVGRWMWHSGELKPGSLLPWQSQAANTVPDHFFWQKDKTSILIIAAGLYEITAGVFGRGSPHLLVNGESLAHSKTQENFNTLNRKPRRKEKEMLSHALREYLMLSPRSRLSLVVNGDASQGFLNVRRL